MHEKNETLRSHRNLQPLQLRRNRHCSSFLRVFVGNDAAIFKSGRCHEKRRALRTASTPSTLPGGLSSTLSSALSHHRSTQCNQPYENEQKCYYSPHFPLHSFYSSWQKKICRDRFYLSLCSHEMEKEPRTSLGSSALSVQSAAHDRIRRLHVIEFGAIPLEYPPYCGCSAFL